jgi:Zn-dependent protease
MNLFGDPLGMIFRLTAILIAITVHEYAHGRVALALGDYTAKMAGRVTLNPIRHIDPMGFILLLLAGFGWARPVPIDPSRFPNPKMGMMIASAAGPLSNLAAAMVLGLLWKMTAGMSPLLSLLLRMAVFYNVALALFNLLPIHPLDGSHVLKGMLPRTAAMMVAQFDRWAMSVLFGVVLMDVVFRTHIIGRVLIRPIMAVSLWILNQ